MLKLPKLSKKLPTVASEELRRIAPKPVTTGRLSPTTAAKIRAKASRLLGTS